MPHHTIMQEKLVTSGNNVAFILSYGHVSFLPF